MNLEELLQKFWCDYLEVTPVAKKVNLLLEERNLKVFNDHIALRTFAHERINKEKFSKFFEGFGYKIRGEYNFKEKKLNAIHLENINDPNLPKIFISELRYLELSAKNIELIEKQIDSLERDVTVEELFSRKDVFQISLCEYESLALESEYAAWLCSIGFRPNHFTVDVNKLTGINSLLELNTLLKENGILLNSFGGEVKGAPCDYLEQSSTMADKTSIKFLDGSKEVPSCYYEFAYRYKLPSGELFQGFIEKSADKIFESTNV